MNWPFRRRETPSSPRLPHAYPMAPDADDDDLGAVATLAAFACSTCGRTDLPEAGDWDPPICEECDAAINFDALTEELDDRDDS
ncbi:MAG TPA: hypothetical protein VES19_04835 [Candidatus Limnocylindrales bacterium]|nr:hypothetical protein [Candidatus Limnocylindrales bacterium]